MVCFVLQPALFSHCLAAANPFHNFEHASHVTMSVTKLLSRIVAPSEHDIKNSIKDESQLHDHTYGITSDPLTQFSCVLSALIHDLDHPGVPNMTLIKENTAMASYYKGKSVAEQNSIDLAWSLLMDDTYKELRHTIYANSRECKWGLVVACFVFETASLISFCFLDIHSQALPPASCQQRHGD